MSGSWIKMRGTLLTHPKVVRIMSATCPDRFRVIGGLLAVWALFDVHSVDGKLHGYTVSAIDESIGWQGFGQALADVQWLTVCDGFLLLPEWDTHNSKSAKRRAEDAKRKSDDRSGKSPKKSGQKSDKKQTRVRVRDIPTSNDVGSALSTKITLADLQNRLPDVPKQLLVDWLTVRKEKRLALTDTALKGTMREIVKAKMTVTDALTFAVERAWGGFKAKWVENERAEAGRRGGGRSEPAWWSSPESVKAEGIRLTKAGVEGAEPRPGEELVSYKARLSALREALARKSGDVGAAS